MAFFDNLGKKIQDTAQAAAQKTKELAEVTKTNISITSEEESIRKQYTVIGEIYYNENKDNPDEKFLEAFSAIEQSMVKISELRIKLESIKPTTKCASCGKDVNKNSRFCEGCGAPLLSADNPATPAAAAPTELIGNNAPSAEPAPKPDPVFVQATEVPANEISKFAGDVQNSNLPPSNQ